MGCGRTDVLFLLYPEFLDQLAPFRDLGLDCIDGNRWWTADRYYTTVVKLLFHFLARERAVEFLVEPVYQRGRRCFGRKHRAGSRRYVSRHALRGDRRNTWSEFGRLGERHAEGT